MKTNWNNTLSRFTGLILAAVMLTACDTSSALGGDEAEAATFDETISFLAVDLGLTTTETAALADSFAKFGDGGGDREPGFLWNVAAELHATLSDEQKARLFDRLEQAGARRRQGQQGQRGQGGQGFGGPGQGNRPGFGQRQGGPSGAQDSGRSRGGLSQIDLTEDQEASIAAIRESFKPQIEAVLAQRETLTRDEIKEQLDAIHELARAEVEAVLTADQIQQIADLKAAAEAERAERELERQANREAAKLVMIDVLGLTDAQVAELDALKASAEADRQTIADLRDSGASQEDVQAAAEALREANETALATILDATQLEITMIHNAIASRVASRMGQKGGKGQGGQGGRRGPGGPGGQGGFGGAVNG